MHLNHLIILSDQFSRHNGRSPATISNWIVGHARLFSRLREGKGTTVKTYNQAVAWFSNRWPSDLPWPDGVPRPAPSKEKDAA